MLTIPQELVASIMSFKEKSFELALARICKALYELYEQHYGELTVTILYESHCILSITPYFIKTLKCLMSQSDWIRLKSIPICEFQNKNSPIKILYLDEAPKLSIELDCTSLDVTIIAFSSVKESMPIISLFKKFSNLRSLELKNISFGSYEKSMFSKLISLEFISLNKCDLTHCDLFANCTNLKEIQLISVFFKEGEGSLCFPAQLKVFIMDQPCILFEIDVSHCTQFECL